MRKNKFSAILEMLVLIAAGVLLMLHPGGSLSVAARILGIALLAYAAVTLIGYFTRDREERSALKLIAGIAAAIGGLVLVTGPRFVVSIFPFLAGILVALGGVRDLLDAFRMKKAGYKSWKLALVLSLVTIVLGVILCANPFRTMEALTVALGVSLLYNGVAGLITAFKS